jgi:hypothetical protein
MKAGSAPVGERAIGICGPLLGGRRPTSAAATPTSWAAVHGAGEPFWRRFDAGYRSEEQNRFVEQCVRDCLARTAQDAGEGLPRHAHALGRGFLIQQLSIRQADGLELVRRERHDRKAVGGPSDRAETPALEPAADAAWDGWPGHVISICS